MNHCLSIEVRSFESGAVIDDEIGAIIGARVAHFVRADRLGGAYGGLEYHLRRAGARGGGDDL